MLIITFAIDLLKDRIFGEIQLYSLLLCIWLLDTKMIHFDKLLNHSTLDVKWLDQSQCGGFKNHIVNHWLSSHQEVEPNSFFLEYGQVLVACFYHTECIGGETTWLSRPGHNRQHNTSGALYISQCSLLESSCHTMKKCRLHVSIWCAVLKSQLMASFKSQAWE